MRMNFAYVSHFNAGIDHQVLPYAEKNFTGYKKLSSLHQLVVIHDAPCNRIFNRHQTGICDLRIFGLFIQFSKRCTADCLNTLPEIPAGGLMMKASFLSLNRNFNAHFKKNPGLEGPGSRCFVYVKYRFPASTC